MTIKNILITAEFYLPMYGGIEQYIKYISRYFVLHNISVTILCSRFDDDLPESDVIHGVNIIYSELLNGALSNPFSILSNSKKISIIIRKINPDIVVANNHSSLAVINASKMSRVPVAYVCHGVGLMCPLKKRFMRSRDKLCWDGMSLKRCSICYFDHITLRKLVGYFLKALPLYFLYKKSYRILNKADACIGNSSLTKRFFRSDKSCDGFPLMIDTDDSEYGYYPVNSSEFCAKFNLEHKRFILVPGRINHIKGQMYALKALSLLPENIKMVFVGNSSLFSGESQDLGDYGKTLKSEIKKNSLQDRIVFTGLLDASEMRQAYSAARITVIPSLWIETFGYVTLESMSCETPVVVTGNCGSAECVDDRVGRVVSRKSSDDIAETIDSIWENAVLMGKTARKKVIEKYSLEVLGKKTLDILNNVLSEAEQ